MALLVCLPFLGASQVNDFGIWTSISVGKALTKELSVSLAEDVRFYENASEISTIYTDAGVGYEINRHVDVELHYRFIRKKQLDDYYESRQRWYADVSYRYRTRYVDFIFRERYQSQYRQARSDRKTLSPESHLRSKITARADMDRPYRPYFSFEWNYQLNGVGGNTVDNLRYRVGADYKFNKTYALGLYYMINKEVNVVAPVTDYVVGVDIEISL